MQMQERPSVGVVVLSMGNRPVELTEAIRTVQMQEGVDLDMASCELGECQ